MLNKCLLKLHNERNMSHLQALNQILDNQFPFTSEIQIDAKIKDGDFHIYHGGFGEVGVYKAKVPDLSEIYEFCYTIGSGRHYASLILKQQNRLFESLCGNNLSQLPLEVNIGIACHVIDEVKDYDIQTGGDTQVLIMDNEKCNEITLDKQSSNYQTMIDSLSNSLKNRPIEDIKNILKIYSL